MKPATGNLGWLCCGVLCLVVLLASPWHWRAAGRNADVPSARRTVYGSPASEPRGRDVRVPSAPRWQSQSSGTLSRLSSIFFLDAQRGWAAGSNGVLLATEDGGAQWRRVQLPADYAPEPLHDLWFFDPARGCVLGEYARTDRRGDRSWTERIFALTSANSGVAWSPASLFHPPPKRVLRALSQNPNNKADRSADEKVEMVEVLQPEPDAVLLRMAFAPAGGVGWACGESGAIQVTRDGGQNWERQPTTTRKLLYDVATINEQQAWAVGASGTVLHTADGGRTWKEQASGTTAALRAVHFTDARRGWAVGADGVMLATTNGGVRWEPQRSDSRRQLNDVFFLNPQEGWVAGAGGLLLHTMNGGATWEDESLSTHAQLNRLFFTAPDCGWVGGASGAIFHYSR